MVAGLGVCQGVPAEAALSGGSERVGCARLSVVAKSAEYLLIELATPMRLAMLRASSADAVGLQMNFFDGRGHAHAAIRGAASVSGTGRTFSECCLTLRR